jgi:hypothetical protein
VDVQPWRHLRCHQHEDRSPHDSHTAGSSQQVWKTFFFKLLCFQGIRGTIRKYWNLTSSPHWPWGPLCHKNHLSPASCVNTLTKSRPQGI